MWARNDELLKYLTINIRGPNYDSFWEQTPTLLLLHMLKSVHQDCLYSYVQGSYNFDLPQAPLILSTASSLYVCTHKNHVVYSSC